jgi:hypothetical protein
MPVTGWLTTDWLTADCLTVLTDDAAMTLSLLFARHPNSILYLARHFRTLKNLRSLVNVALHQHKFSYEP